MSTSAGGPDQGTRDSTRETRETRETDRDTGGHRRDGATAYGDDGPRDRPLDRRTVVRRQKEEHGGVKIGSAFFGFLTAVGVGVLLTALLAAAGTAVGISTGTNASEAVSKAGTSASTVGIVGGIVLLVILFVAYYCGGYVASRMARFNGIKQGLAVWLWALLIAVVVAVLGAVFGSKYDILARLNSFPRIPVSEGNLTTGGIIAAVAVVVASLAGALLGGLAGMRFHRAVDRTGLGS
jgi:hypothetical protein